MHFYNNFGKECLCHGRFVECGIVVATLHVSHRQAIGSPWVYPWMDISMDIPMDIQGKICGYGWEISYPRQARWSDATARAGYAMTTTIGLIHFYRSPCICDVRHGRLESAQLTAGRPIMTGFQLAHSHTRVSQGQPEY